MAVDAAFNPGARSASESWQASLHPRHERRVSVFSTLRLRQPPQHTRPGRGSRRPPHTRAAPRARTDAESLDAEECSCTLLEVRPTARVKRGIIAFAPRERPVENRCFAPAPEASARAEKRDTQQLGSSERVTSISLWACELAYCNHNPSRQAAYDSTVHAHVSTPSYSLTPAADDTHCGNTL